MGASLFYVSDAARLMAVAKLDTTSADDQGLFGITRSALASRVSDHDGVLYPGYSSRLQRGFHVSQ
jgi:hypothetical protein